MAKIQSRVGNTLADTYDARGGIAGLEELRTQEVALVHEMGDTIQSERFSGTIRRRSAGAISQNSNFDSVISDLPAGVSRILGIAVLVDADRLSLCTVLLRDPVAAREMPILIWEAGDTVAPLRIDDAGSGGANTFVLVAPSPNSPVSLLVGTGQPQRVSDIALRGSTTGFGAGTVEPILLVHLAFAAIGGLSSRGLPIPSW